MKLTDERKQMDPMAIYRVFLQNTKEYILIPALHRTYSKIDNIIKQKASLNRSKKIELNTWNYEIPMD